MKLSQLLAKRSELLRQARLANQAFAFERLEEFARRLTRAGIRGGLRLQQVSPENERYCATLTGECCNPSVIEEHFTEEELVEFADAVALSIGANDIDLCFPAEDLRRRFQEPLRQRLEAEGVLLDPATPEFENSGNHENDESGQREH